MSSSTTAAGEPPPEKCPCCDNPWSRATGDFFDKLVCDACEENEAKTATTTTTATGVQGLDRANMDLTVSPAENFYQYANGGWIANNPIPKGYPNWNSFLALHVQSQERCKTILEELMTSNDSDDSKDCDEETTETTNRNVEEAKKVATYYRAAIDESAIEALGIEPMVPLFQQIDAIVDAFEAKDTKRYANLLGQLDATFGTYAVLYCILYTTFDVPATYIIETIALSSSRSDT